MLEGMLEDSMIAEKEYIKDYINNYYVKNEHIKAISSLDDYDCIYDILDEKTSMDIVEIGCKKKTYKPEDPIDWDDETNIYEIKKLYLYYTNNSNKIYARVYSYYCENSAYSNRYETTRNNLYVIFLEKR